MIDSLCEESKYFDPGVDGGAKRQLGGPPEQIGTLLLIAPTNAEIDTHYR